MLIYLGGSFLAFEHFLGDNIITSMILHGSLLQLSDELIEKIIGVNKRNQIRNKAYKSTVRTVYKKCLIAITTF